MRGEETRRSYFAHSAEVDKEGWQPLSAHLEGTAARAAAFLESVGLDELGRVAGLLHDLGKYTDQFQARLEGSPRRFDHAAPGAKLAVDRYGDLLGKMLAFCVAGHHAGLANGVNGEGISALEERLRGAVSMPDPIWEQEIALPAVLTPPRLKPRSTDTVGFCAAFLVRMLFSALVDADYLDTEAYYTGLEGTPTARGKHPDLAELSRRLEAHLDSLQANAERRDVNDVRAEVLAHARQGAAERQGVFALTVPTGGGKTLASLAFALDHAGRHGLDRVIYVIPYMSIIEQTASVFRDALRGGDGRPADFVIEHHSTFDEERIGDRESSRKLHLAMENWDAPIIVTTAVQFFESLFANRPSRCRKLHNIANSVVILDEAQTLPLKCLRPCVTALDELARNWRASVVLCTATQPALREADGFTGGFQHVRELAPAPRRLYETLQRTRMRHVGRMADTELTDRLRESPQVLCIVNTRRHARELYEQLADAEGACHLSTLMYASHRREHLDAVRQRLEDGKPVRLIATSLVEAGVDFDFPIVWRAEAGLESIIQAAGRCNREGRAPQGDVFVFEPAAGEGRKPPPDVAQFADAARSVMRRYSHDNWTSLDAIRAYFRELYWLKGDAALDEKQILQQCAERRHSLDFPFETIAREFRLIDDAQAPVVVPGRGKDGTDDTAARLLRNLEHVPRPGPIARKLQPYVVQIPPSRREALLAVGAARTVREQDFGRQFVVLANLDLYDEHVGLKLDDPTTRIAEGLVY